MSRAIDVEKAIEIIETKQKELCPVGRYGRNYVYGSDREKYDAWDEIIDVLENLPTLTPPNEWVSVENAFPPKNESVLCIVSGKPKPNITLKDAYQLGSWNKADGWIIDEWLDWEEANVTWWTKLPEPPDRRPPEGEA